MHPVLCITSPGVYTDLDLIQFCDSCPCEGMLSRMLIRIAFLAGQHHRHARPHRPPTPGHHKPSGAQEPGEAALLGSPRLLMSPITKAAPDDSNMDR